MNAVFDLYSTEIDADPFPAYRRLRDEHPCYWIEEAGLWILSRYDDVSHAAQDWQTFSSAGGNMVDEIPGRAGGTLGTTDPPRHDRLRALTQSAFMRRNNEGLEALAAELARGALDRIVATRRFDFIDDFSSRITVGALFRMLGLPARDHAEIRRKVILAISTDKALKGRNAEQLAAFAELGRFITDEVAERRRQPRNDLISHMAEAEIDNDRLTEREIVLTAATFVMAGVESLSSFLSMFVLNLHNHPEARRQVAEEPGLTAAAIEESLRFNTSAQRFRRVLTKDVDLHGCRMRAGDGVILAYGSANRDERKFPDPDTYDIRRRPHGHLGFGACKHFCIGSQMARLVTEVTMQCFLQRLPDFHLTCDHLEWVPSSNFRSPMALPFEII